MRVKLTRDYKCAPNGYETVSYSEGQIVEGQAAVFALADKAGKQITENKPKKAKPDKPSVTK